MATVATDFEVRDAGVGTEADLARLGDTDGWEVRLGRSRGAGSGQANRFEGGRSSGGDLGGGRGQERESEEEQGQGEGSFHRYLLEESMIIQTSSDFLIERFCPCGP